MLKGSLDELLVRVQEVHQLVGVHFLGRSEENHFIQRRHTLQELSEEWPRPHVHLKIQNVSK